MSKKKILMLIGDYVEDYEVMVAFQALLMVSATSSMLFAPTKNQAPLSAPPSTISKETKATPKNPATISS